MTVRVDRRRQRGIALPMALWTGMALALLAAGIAATADRATRRQAGQDQVLNARALLETGISLGVMLAVHPDPARRLAADGSPLAWEEPEGRITLRLWDEGGRLDLNRADPARLTMIAARVAGAEAAAALSAALAEKRRGEEPWHSVMELGAVLPPAAFARLYPLLTVHGPAMADGRVDLRHAAPALRAGWPGLSGVGEGDAAALSVLGLTRGGPPGSLYTLRVRARTPDGASASAEAVIWISIAGPQAFRVLEWREPAPEIDPDPEVE